MNPRLMALFCLLALGLVGCGGGGHSTDSAGVVSVTTPTTGVTTGTATAGSTTSTGVDGSSARAGRGDSATKGSGSSRTGEGGGNTKHGAAGSSGSQPKRTKHDAAGRKGRRGSSSSPVAHPTRPGVAAPGSPGAGSASANANTGVPYKVSTSSMLPSYKPLSTVYYDPTRSSPHIGDVVLFYLPVGATEGACGTVEGGGEACREPASSALTQTISIKRVVGVGGDTIAMHDGLVIRNGQLVSEPYASGCEGAGCEYPKAITVPAGSYYVLSDDRQLYQEDSRVFGAVRQGAIVGTVEDG